MTASADQPGATQRPGPCEPLAMAQAALTALNAAAACWDAKAPHDLHAQDSERFLRVASACAQVAIAERLTMLIEAVQALPAAAGTLGAAAGKAAAADIAQAAKRLADIQDAAAENLSRLADEAELWRLQEPPATPPPPLPSVSRLHATPADGHVSGAEGTNTGLMSQAQMDGMYAVLSDADSARDAEALADAAWRLYAEAVAARAEAALAQPPAAARAPAAAPHQNAGRHELTPRDVLTEHPATAECDAGGEPS